MSEVDRKTEKHNQAMAKQQEVVNESIAAAAIEKSICLLLTGDGKGKTSSAFGMAMRALGYRQKVGIVQFIKGEQLSGEELFVKNNLPEVFFYQMGTGFTWDTQNREADIAAAKTTWSKALKLLQDPAYDLVILDELTYMLAFDYLPEGDIIQAIQNRPKAQSVVVTGRGGGSKLRDIADTVSEVKAVKHAFNDGVMARKGVDY